jgi:hypothetical protein
VVGQTVRITFGLCVALRILGVNQVLLQLPGRIKRFIFLRKQAGLEISQSARRIVVPRGLVHPKIATHRRTSSLIPFVAHSSLCLLGRAIGCENTVIRISRSNK